MGDLTNTAAGLSLAALLALGGACGLQLKPLPTRHAQSNGVVVRDNPFAPVEIRIHPLTRVLREKDADGEASIEAHIEMIDQVGDSVKGAGLLTLELYHSAGATSQFATGNQIERWTLDLVDQKGNSEAYDRVTRTYRVILTGFPESVGTAQTMTLRVRLTTPSGRQLSSEARLGW